VPTRGAVFAASPTVRVRNGGELTIGEGSTLFSELTIDAGGTLNGKGRVSRLNLIGFIGPGASPGTLNIDGNFAMRSSAVYQAEVEGALSDRIDVGGAATLGGTLQLIPQGGAYWFATPYTLLSAAGGLGGTRFATITTQGSFSGAVASNVSYTNNAVLLTLTPQLSRFVQSTAGGNARNVATGLDAALAAGADPGALIGLYSVSANAAAAALNSLSGEVHTATRAIGVAAEDQFLRAMLNPFLPNRGAKAGDGVQVWAAPLGARTLTGGGGAAKRETNTGSLAFGVDAPISASTILGGAFAYGEADANLAAGQGKATAETLQIGAYASDLPRFFGPRLTGKLGRICLSCWSHAGRLIDGAGRGALT
jgi:uncharacterized protein with beta-barrel porin domain